MEFDDRIIAGHEKESDTWQYSLRPRLLSEYIGQKKIKDNLSVFHQGGGGTQGSPGSCASFWPSRFG
jgi:Holliday junction resolvasome RuvABC ATP-dependent DNA helicase subunit